MAVYAVQRFWFLRAWTWIAAFSNANWRFGLHVGLIVLAAALLATLLDPLLGHGISRLSLGSFNLGKSLTTVARLWMIASFFGFLAVESVGAIEWVTNVAARLLPHPGAAAGGFSPERRTFFQYAAVLAGGFPFLAATYGFAAGRLRYSIERVDVRSPIFLRSWMGCALLSSATSILATTCRRTRLLARLTWLTICSRTFPLLQETSSQAKAIRWTPALPS